MVPVLVAFRIDRFVASWLLGQAGAPW